MKFLGFGLEILPLGYIRLLQFWRLESFYYSMVPIIFLRDNVCKARSLVSGIQQVVSKYSYWSSEKRIRARWEKEKNGLKVHV